MIRYFFAIALLISASSQPSLNVRVELESLRRQAQAAREVGDKGARLQIVLEVQRLVNDAPRAVEASARAYADAGDAQHALTALSEFARQGQVDEALLDGKDPILARLASMPKYKAILARMKNNKRPVSKAAVVLTLADPGLVAEDIAYDEHSKSFLITSILQKKIVRVAMNGTATDFAQSPSHWPMFAIKVDDGRNWVWATEAALKDFTASPKADWGRSAVVCFDLKTGALLDRIEGPPNSALGDLALLRTGDPMVSDGYGGGVYRVANGKLVLINDRDFISPQTPDVLPDGKHVLVPDYLRGIAILDLETGHVSWLSQINATQEKVTALSGIDGLYFFHNSLVLTQNGTSPERVVEIRLDDTLTHVISEQIIERSTPTLGDPTHGVIVGNNFYYIANSGWSELDDHGDIKPGSKLTPARLMRTTLR